MIVFVPAGELHCILKSKVQYSGNKHIHQMHNKRGLSLEKLSQKL